MTAVRAAAAVAALVVASLLPYAAAVQGTVRQPPTTRATIAATPVPVIAPIIVPVATPRMTARASRSLRRPPSASSVAAIAARAADVSPRVAPSGRPAPLRAAMWQRLVDCEAPGRGWQYGAPDVGVDAGYRYEGGPNFTASTWLAYRLSGMPAHAYDATPDQQIAVAERVLAAQGVRAWPVCGPRIGLVRR